MKAIIAITALLVVDLTNAFRCRFPVHQMHHCLRLIKMGKITRNPECCCHPYISYARINVIKDCNALGFPVMQRPTPAPTPPPTTTYKPHEEMDNMIDKSSALWPQQSDGSLITVEEGTDGLKLIDTSSVQGDSIDQVIFSLKKGRCGKRAVSIESKQHAGKFWRHQAGKIHIQGGEDTEDICFNVVKAGCEDGGFALEAATNPDKFVQKCGDNVELRTRADNCGDESNMCWANLVSEQARLSYCESKVTKEDDVYKYPQCCSHEGTLEKFGACCRENITTCSYPDPPSTASSGGGFFVPAGSSTITTMKLRYCLYKIRQEQHLQRYPMCCMHPLMYRKYQKPCQRMIGLKKKKKRAVAACNFPCSRISYCPNRMTRQHGWEYKGNKNCCCHPYRIKMIQIGHPNQGNCNWLG